MRKQDFFNKNITQGKIWKHNAEKSIYVSLYTLQVLRNNVDEDFVIKTNDKKSRRFDPSEVIFK